MAVDFLTMGCSDVQHALSHVLAELLGEAPEGVHGLHQRRQKGNVLLGAVLRWAHQRPQAEGGMQGVDGSSHPGARGSLALQLAVRGAVQAEEVDAPADTIIM
eukprot:scaffold75781_cov37-Prasinocladus_malaysianus.AAC.1